MNIPNSLTVLRVMLIPVFLLALFIGYTYAAVIIFILAAFTDLLDGFIARKYNLVTNLGKFMDPLADKLLVCAALISMIELKLLPALVVILIISREFIVTGFRLVAADNNIVLAAGMSGKIKTVVQMLMIVYLLLGFGGLMGNMLIWTSVILTIISAVEYISQNRQVLRE